MALQQLGHLGHPGACLFNWVAKGPPAGLGRPAALSTHLPDVAKCPDLHLNVHFQLSCKNFALLQHWHPQ